jgi:hypothetical protein
MPLGSIAASKGSAESTREHGQIFGSCMRVQWKRRIGRKFHTQHIGLTLRGIAKQDRNLQTSWGPWFVVVDPLQLLWCDYRGIWAEVGAAAKPITSAADISVHGFNIGVSQVSSQIDVNRSVTA